MLHFNFRKPSKIFDWICFKFTLFWKFLIGNIHHNKYTMIKKNSIFILSSFISLFLGTVIYILFRTSSLKVFSWFKYFELILEKRIYKMCRKYTSLDIVFFTRWVMEFFLYQPNFGNLERKYFTE